MKTFFASILFLFICVGCTKVDNFSDEIDQTDVNLMTRASSDSNFDELNGMLVNILVSKGISNDRKFLSANKNGERVDLWHEDDNSGRQKWIFQHLGNGYYTIEIYSGISGAKRFLSTNKDGSSVDLWTVNDNTGRQIWKIEDVPNSDLKKIRIKGGVTGARDLLSVTSNGGKADLYTTDDNSGRQRWRIVPIDEFELVSYKYYLSPTDVIVPKPDFITSARVTNNTSVNQSLTFNFTRRATESSSFSQTNGISITSSIKTSVKTPIVSFGSIDVSLTTSYSKTWQFGSTETNEDSRSYSFPVNVPPYTTIDASAIVSLNEISARYEAVVRSKITGMEAKIAGVWEGVLAGDINFTLTNPNTGQVLKMLHSIPSVGQIIYLDK